MQFLVCSIVVSSLSGFNANETSFIVNIVVDDVKVNVADVVDVVDVGVNELVVVTGIVFVLEDGTLVETAFDVGRTVVVGGIVVAGAAVVGGSTVVLSIATLRDE